MQVITLNTPETTNMIIRLPKMLCYYSATAVILVCLLSCSKKEAHTGHHETIKDYNVTLLYNVTLYNGTLSRHCVFVSSFVLHITNFDWYYNFCTELFLCKSSRQA